MEYRKLGRTGLNVSAIGLGTEHLPTENMEGVFCTAVDAGANYVDLLYSNPGSGPVWDKICSTVSSYRDKLILAAHWVYLEDPNESEQNFENTLARLCKGYADVAILQCGLVRAAAERLLRFKEQGQIGYIGVSCHDTSTSIKIVNTGLTDVLMVPVNLMNLVKRESEKIAELYHACVEHDVGLVAMKPYWGGKLFSHPGITPTQCLAYVLSQPVSTTVPGVSNVEQLQAALHYLEATDEEKDYRSVIENIPTVWRGECLYCGHCRPCPQDIDIGSVIKYADLMDSPDYTFDELLYIYAGLQVKASECTECGDCMERCPFEVDVIAKMREAVEIFETNAG